MISRWSAESPTRHFRIIAPLSFFSSVVPGSSPGSSIACSLFVQLLVRPTPEGRESLEARDRQHPCGHRRAPFKSTSLAPHVEKHLADQILCHALIAYETHHEPKHSHMMPRVEHLHSQPIAVRDSSDQHLV